MAFTSSIFSHIPLNNQRIFPPNSHKPKPPRTTITTAALPPLAAVTAADLDGTTLAVIGGGSVAALAAAISITDPERRRRLQAEEVGGGDKEVVREYFNNSGFQRWRKIYGETDEVNRVQKDIRLGHSQTVENVLKMLKDEGSLEGVSVCDAGCGTGCLAIPLAKEKTSYHFSQESLPKEITRAISKSCIHHLLAVPVFEQRLLENMEGGVAYENDLNLKATELRLGLPGTSCTNEEQAVSGARNNKRPLPETREGLGAKGKSDPRHDDQETAPAPKAQIVGWPPIRSSRKNILQPKKAEAEAAAGMYVKVSMDGAPYLRKIDLKVYKGYPELLKALENMFKLTIGEYSEREGYKGSEYAPTYEDKDGDWMLIGDVPWDMFLSSCKKLRIIKGSEATG